MKTDYYVKFQPKNKIPFDSYYTPKDLALKLILKTIEVIGKENINEIIEPSAGNGAFSSQIPGCIAYDLYSNTKGIIKQDFLKLDIPYDSNRLIIGNPPFGRASILARQFIKHSNKLSGYYAFILPSSFIINRLKLNILFAENLGEVVFDNGKKKGSKEYQERKVVCSFIIYKHTDNKISYPKYKLKDVSVFELRKRKPKCDVFDTTNYDYKFIRWGSGSKLCEIKTNKEPFTNSIYMYAYIKIHNKKLKQRIYNELLKLKPLIQQRRKEKLFTSAPSIQMFEVYGFLSNMIPELK